MAATDKLYILELMNNPEIQTLCVCGAGTMGSGIAQAAAQAGIFTILYDLNPAMLEKAEAAIRKNLQQQTEKGKLAPGMQEAILQRLQFTGDVQSCLADLFIEAIVEKTGAKVALFNQLAEINHSECIFATNTSSLSVTEIARQVQHPERVIGLHFFNPATLMKLVEVVFTDQTAKPVLDTALELVRQLGKTPVVCRDAPGFIVNRVARPFYIEALRQAETGAINLADIDHIMEATGFRMGPFRLMDLIGHDVNYAVSCSVYEQLGRPERLRPSALQEANVQRGALGRKTGEGFYRYP
jgi:3-hydroxybutyryl-CoA dehydrogenase